MATRDAPTYLRIANELRQRIREGVLAPGDMLPSEAGLCGEFRIARGTARQVFAVLERDGLIDIAPGRGRTVRGSAAPDRAQYQRIAAEMRASITRGDLKPGDRLPSEATLVEKHGVSRGTARQALALLVNEGYAVSRQGRGRFVSSSPSASSP